MELIFLVLGLAVIFYVYRGRSDTTNAPASISRDASEIDAVDFYWRPG